MRLEITEHFSIPMSEIELMAIRSQGPGGQNVNKVSTAIHLRFDIRASSLPELCQQRLLALSDHRVTRDGVVVIKAQQGRSQQQNKTDALQRLQEMIQATLITQQVRRPTRPTRSAQRKRMEHKAVRGELKSLRRKIVD
jgi:ribosome-associated protein